MKEIWLAQWGDDNSPQFASSTLEKLFKKIDEWYNYPNDMQVIKGKFERNSEEFDEYRYGKIKYTTTNYLGEDEIDNIYILNYYYD